MNYQEQLKQISDYVHSYFIEHANGKFLYHNLGHTKEMVEASKKISDHYKLNEHDNFIVTAAAWFHDTGYLVAEIEVHEMKSAELAENYLVGAGVNIADIMEIKNCILATKLPQRPSTQLENIVCDADLYHLGTDHFKENSKLLKKETEAITGQPIDGTLWRANNIRLLESHEYHTDYCKELLTKVKLEHLEKLKRKQEEKAAEKDQTAQGEHPTAGIAAEDSFPNIGRIYKVADEPAGSTTNGDAKAHKKDKDKPTRSEKSIETMFRIASANHQRLSSMADNKAHIMISVNSIIVSVVIGLLLKKLDTERFLAIPTIILLVFSLITIIYSVLATRPQIPNGYFTREQVINKSTNLLFFGNFYKMSYTDYDWGMKRMMNDRDFLYESLINDMYWHGVVLGKKYRLLRTSYSVFMYGLSVSIIAFTISILFI
jgi:predicted metal-dependent HD superfamily phosphohydrolase